MGEERSQVRMRRRWIGVLATRRAIWLKISWRQGLVEVAYAIGVAEPVSLNVNTHGTSRVALTDGEIARRALELFDMRPAAIVERFGMLYPIYFPTAAYGHFGRDPYRDVVKLLYGGKETEKEVDFFAWEKLDYVERVQRAFGL